MGKTLLQIINTAQQELGLPVSSSVIGNQDATTTQMYALLNMALDELRECSEKGWVALQTEFDIAVQPPTTTFGTITQNSKVIINIPSTAMLVANFNSFAINAPNIPPASRIASVDSDNQITMTMEATGSSTTLTTLVLSSDIFDRFGNIIYDRFGSPIQSRIGITVNVLADQIQFGQDVYALPTDFDYYINRTWWDRTNHWELLGPDSPQLDEWHRSGIVATGPRRHFRQLGPYPNSFRFWPPPFELVNPIQAVFEYISLDAVQNLGGYTTFTQYFQNDADTCLLSDRALILSLKWRFWEQKGMNWASKRSEYDRYVERLISRDGGSETLTLARRPNAILISDLNVQDGYFPGPMTNT